jgi:hypothetical protein
MEQEVPEGVRRRQNYEIFVKQLLRFEFIPDS